MTVEARVGQPASPGRVMMLTAAVLVVLSLAWLTIRLRAILILLLLGVIFATAIEPLVHRLRRRGLSRGQAIMVVYLSIAAVLALVLYLVVPSLAHQASGLVNDIPSILRDLHTKAASSKNGFVNSAGVRAIERAQQAYADWQSSPPIKRSTALTLVTSVVGGLFTIVSVMIVAFYWMTEKAIIKRLVLGLVPLPKRDRAHHLWDEIEAKLGGWTRGQLTLCGLMAAASGIAYFALGVRFWLPLAAWVGATEVIPYIGPVLGGGAAVIVALSESWHQAVLVAVVALILQQLEGHVLVPRVMSNAVGMTPLTVVIAVFSGERLMGPLGAVLAVPVGAAVQVLIQELLRVYRAEPDVVSVPVLGEDGVGNEPLAGRAILGRLRGPD